MPEVIDLLSSTPPPPAQQFRQPSVPTSPPYPPLSAAPRPLVSDDVESLFAYDGYDKPAKRRRISVEPESPRNCDLQASANQLFLFSDDDFPLPSDGPSLNPPARNDEVESSKDVDIRPSTKNLFSFSDDLILSSDGPFTTKTPTWEGEVIDSSKQSESQPTRNLFSFSDDVILSSEGPLNMGETTWNGKESDPIVFTSSAPERGVEVARTRDMASRGLDTITIDDDDDDNDNDRLLNDHAAQNDHIEDFSDQLGLPDIEEMMRHAKPTKSTENPLFSSRTADLLASLESRPRTGSGNAQRPRTGGPSKAKPENDLRLEDDLSDVVAESRKAVRKPSKLTTVDREAKAREREAAKAQREHERQLEKERKQKLKEEKAREKQLAADLAEVNKLKVDKKDSTPEMIIDLASSFQETSVGNQSVELMKRLGVEHTFFSSSIPNIVKWRRKVTARFNEDAGHWEPCRQHIKEETHVLCLIPAQEFVDMVISPADPATSTTDLELHLQRIRTAYPACKPIYLIEGLAAWMRKNQNSRNRAFQAQVRQQLDQQNPDNAPSTRRRKPPANKPESTPPVDEDTIEDALLELQVTHACLIHHTGTAPESAEWIKNFTEHVSTIPYKRERMNGNDAAFCMDTGQVKPGEDKPDTFVKMLQEVNRVTASMAYGIAARYPSVLDLVRCMRRHGPGMLEDVKKSANKNGALTDSRIGPAASKRLYKVFMGLDPSSTDV
ncbi:uncharacterized protein ACLA_016190 [Aspergillus clavatus NRRL 1]|uniref:ERCC4 domain-containing protein n=1 Tax=Aspergillus clavatus (strain ATCC 1007 / CBS 513.65 / DSM 816 / NCTC 3887 / NRRL 1 / QM 1276 / 107) TaxID=344612 RepID=A1CBQ5_ASPCL|nr:uncharacterized protein ACLA_016190 [Aspergillus clavatus NRRL 1]EAW13173.1 conserved hypothetical protein [Aspergillus clavatus NRRL 1]